MLNSAGISQNFNESNMIYRNRTHQYVRIHLLLSSVTQNFNESNMIFMLSCNQNLQYKRYVKLATPKSILRKPERN